MPCDAPYGRLLCLSHNTFDGRRAQIPQSDDVIAACRRNHTPVSACLYIKDPAAVSLQGCYGRLTDMTPDRLDIMHRDRPIIGSNKHMVRIRYIRTCKRHSSHGLSTVSYTHLTLPTIYSV